MKLAFLVLASLCVWSCAATVGSLAKVPKDSPATCATFCTDMGLTLSSVVVMANNVGCVCNASKATASDEAATSAGGVAALLMQEEAHRQQQSSSTSSPPPAKH